jgi:hypothetical protein
LAGWALEVTTGTEVASSLPPATHDLPDRADDAAVPRVSRAEVDAHRVLDAQRRRWSR